MTLLGLLVAVIICFVVIWAIQQLAATFGIPDQIRVVLVVLIVVVFVIWLLGGLTGGLTVPLRVR